MPSILSKILMPEWNLPYNCYELGHTWTPFCTEAALEIGLIVFNQSLKLYTPLYLANQVVFSRKFDRKSFEDSVRSILRSSVFLGINAFLVIAFFCLSRHILGRFYYTLCAYVPSFFGSLLAILAERPSRRRALAFYVANIGSETLYRILVSRGYITPVPGGQFLLFSAAVTSLVYLYETGTLKDPLINFVVKLVLGSRKASEVVKAKEADEKTKQLENDQLITKRSIWHRFGQLYEQLKTRFPYRIPFDRHRHCPHTGTGCIEDIFFSGLLKPFLIGYTSTLAMRTVPRLFSLKPAVFSETLLNPRYLFSSRHTSFGLFLASFTTLYKSTRCALRWATGRNDAYHSLVACMAAAPTQFINPSTSVTLYLVWKCIESFFNIAARKGLIPYHQVVVHVIYAMACAELFYAAVLDPQHIKPSYKRFLDRVTENKLAYINRNILEVFGTNSATGYESLLPIYDLDHTTRRFQESVLVWLL